ncbi:hypothetical protein CPLU01_11052 [Colletotrichum plurivorum]|uniref:DUF6604 domain-containing protein n=1 Tax=Colletotrichum plurivorum TaxID=2175906 RepID=A0A8H6N973_9PEZI|nr:hypothetical protein CPLU01_11052 [Colletotrichum plurivorum]
MMGLEMKESYVQYKKDTRHFLYWIINTSNSIIETCPISRSSQVHLPAVNTTGETTVDGLVAMTELINAHMAEVPSAILQLVQSIIKARRSHFDAHQRLASASPDADLQRKNASHKYFIDTLQRVFTLLGGDEGLAQRDTGDGAGSKDNTDDEVDDIEKILFSNKFSALHLSLAEASSDEDSVEDNEHLTRSQQRQRKTTGRKAKQKRKSKKASSAAGVGSANVPLNNYRLLESDESKEAEHFVAMLAMRSEWIEARHVLQTTWKGVSYDGVNCAVAGAVSNVAIAKLKRTELEIFVDFPGLDNYDSAIQSLAGGDPERCQQIIDEVDSKRDPEDQCGPIDVKEMLLYYAYEVLVIFVTDFQKNRNGKPTKAMQASLGNWDRELNLHKATKRQRLDWRREFGVNWLYDMVNVYLSAYIDPPKKNTEQQTLRLDQIDLSASEHRAHPHRLLGLNEFASFVTSLALQKPGKPFRHKILPHHVLHMQSIIDATAVSHGWAIVGNGNHIVVPPGQARGAVHDINQFLGQDLDGVENDSIPSFIRSVELLDAELEYQAHGQRDPKVYQGHARVMKELSSHLYENLGISDFDRDREDLPPSRFAAGDKNGLWTYSPFLCGVGLAESLQLAYAAAMSIWDAMPEVPMMVHLQNMLHKEGYMERADFIHLIGGLFPDAMYADGRTPESDFAAAFRKWRDTKGLGCFNRRAAPNTEKPTMPSASDVGRNRTFNFESYLIMHRQADWDPRSIPADRLEPWTGLAMLRMGQMRQDAVGSAGLAAFEQAELVRRARLRGFTEDGLLATGNMLKGIQKAAIRRSTVAPSYRPRIAREQLSGARDVGKLMSLEYFMVAKVDFSSDISGPRPMSGINYCYLTAVILKAFAMMEVELGVKQDPLYLRSYEPKSWQVHKLGVTRKRALFVEQLLTGKNEDTLKAVADVLSDIQGNVTEFVYWNKLVDPLEELAKEHRERGVEVPVEAISGWGCSPM